MKTNIRFHSLLLSLALVLLATVGFPADQAMADEILIYRMTESSKSESYTQPYFENSFDPVSGAPIASARPGGRNKSRRVQRAYLILNKTTGDYSVVYYQSYRDRTTRQRVKNYTGPYRLPTSSALFETDASQRRNYSVLSLTGTGRGTNYTDFTGANSTFHFCALQTLIGTIRTQTISTPAGKITIDCPSVYRGKGNEERQGDDGSGGATYREYVTIKLSLRLVKRLTGLASPGTLDTGEDAVLDELAALGYVPVPVNP